MRVADCQAHVAYIPEKKVLGISKIARLVDAFAKRLQTQETLTAQIANAIQDNLRPQGVAVLIETTHQCMSTRGVHKADASTVTTCFMGKFKTDNALENRFLKMIGL